MATTNLERVNTTFWTDFTIADRFGLAAVEDTYRRAFAEWQSDVRYFAELALTLNHKIWEHWAADENSPFAELYNRLWNEANDWAWNHYTDEEQTFYYHVTD